MGRYGCRETLSQAYDGAAATFAVNIFVDTNIHV